MSIRYSRLASRSFIIGSRLCPPATSRAPSAEPLQQPDGVVDARGALVLERCRNLHAPLPLARAWTAPGAVSALGRAGCQRQPKRTLRWPLTACSQGRRLPTVTGPVLAELAVRRSDGRLGGLPRRPPGGSPPGGPSPSLRRGPDPPGDVRCDGRDAGAAGRLPAGDHLVTRDRRTGWMVRRPHRRRGPGSGGFRALGRPGAAAGDERGDAVHAAGRASAPRRPPRPRA